MLDKKIVGAINKQIGMEYYSAYLYLSISVYYEDTGLFGFEKWYKVQAQEECGHAAKFITYLQDNDAAVVLPAIDAPKATFADGIEPANIAYDHECKITASIIEIAKIAQEVNDFRTLNFLDWFHKEQLEDEHNASDVLKRLSHFGSSTQGLIYMDKEMGDRIQ